MRCDVLRIRNGVSCEQSIPVIQGLFLQVMEGSLYGIMCDSEEKRHLIGLLSGRSAFDSGEVIYRGNYLQREFGKPISLPRGRISILGQEKSVGAVAESAGESMHQKFEVVSQMASSACDSQQITGVVG